MSVQLACECRFCGRELTPQGHKSHETYCDENPNRGLSYDQQREFGVLPDDLADDGPGARGARRVDRETGGSADPDPNQDAGADLPPVETLTGRKKGGGSASAAGADRSYTDDIESGGGPGDDRAAGDGDAPTCPLCGSADVLAADVAKGAYIAAVDRPNGRAVLAYEMADWACQNPDCAAMWGAEYHEPVTMQAVMDA